LLLRSPPDAPVGCTERDPRECLILHIARSLVNAGPAAKPGSIRADCPVCERAGCLTVTAGDSRRFVLTCHAECKRTRIRDAIIQLGVPEDCLPPIREERARGKARKSTDAEIVRELRDLLDSPFNGNAFRLRAAMLLLDLDAVAAADHLKIPERTRRRLLCPDP